MRSVTVRLALVVPTLVVLSAVPAAASAVTSG